MVCTFFIIISLQNISFYVCIILDKYGNRDVIPTTKKMVAAQVRILESFKTFNGSFDLDGKVVII